jgi:U3 small nucleolar RNA-associated protein 20
MDRSIRSVRRRRPSTIARVRLPSFHQMSTESLSFISLLEKLAHDLRTTLSPIYTNILNRLLKLLPRSINATALTALSTLFKFLLVHIELLEDTWDAVCLMLPKCLPEVQRAMAEVWGSILRRLKTVPRTRAMTLLAKNVEGVRGCLRLGYCVRMQGISMNSIFLIVYSPFPISLYHERFIPLPC